MTSQIIWILQKWLKFDLWLKKLYPGSSNNNKLEKLKHFNHKSKKNNI